MAGCCDNNESFNGTSPAYRRVLWIVIAINAVMFVVEMTAGAAAGSKALQADALDFLGDTLTYAISLYVIGKPIHMRATAALMKGGSLALMGVGVLGWTIYHTFVLGVPNATVMSGVAFLAFAANVVCALLLLKFRDGDSNVRSVWLCSRNDAIGNIAVIAAAGAVMLTGSAWPDLIVAAAMAALFLQSSIKIIRQATTELRLERADIDLGVVEDAPDR